MEAAAERLKLHNKTVLRFIREGRLRATKIGKQYRILHSDLDAFAGVGSAREAPAARVTAVVDVPNVDQELLRRLTSIMLGAAGSSEQRPQAISVDIAHDPIRRAVKVIAVGTPSDVSGLLKLVDACLEA
ncbi:helix-turn-helix domain-containing protein [Rhizobiaceae bacterium BDR2-2]|uniref:Helix-turn-helix domain-containing protein n=1 Tax=Ectorhizobium quercum TaxID=2965071 RepID=A0AAE3MX16_9HYPH|nr:helix-turn-helix domain-containing protein [Ectorhizobium quercum]MCX8996499.1 helix-turn-helix domain-containing protein [Ectorhizobium quercum]